jgi:hypothetical protein
MIITFLWFWILWRILKQFRSLEPKSCSWYTYLTGLGFPGLHTHTHRQHTHSHKYTCVHIITTYLSGSTYINSTHILETIHEQHSRPKSPICIPYQAQSPKWPLNRCLTTNKSFVHFCVWRPLVKIMFVIHPRKWIQIVQPHHRIYLYPDFYIHSFLERQEENESVVYFCRNGIAWLCGIHTIWLCK